MSVRFAVSSLTVLVAAIAAPAMADDLAVTGSVRLRFETIDGQPRAGFGTADSLVNLRTQVMAQYDAKPFRLVAELYDSRVWGDDATTPVTTGEVNALELVQAFVTADLGPVLGKGTKTTLQGGRFTLNLGSRRLVAADDYRNTTNGYTGLRADVAAPGGVRATVIYTLPQTRLPDDSAGLRPARVRFDRESFDAVLWGGLVSRPVSSKSAQVKVTAEASMFHFGERDAPGRPTRDRSLTTAGARVMADPKAGHWDGEVEGMFQWGAISASLLPGAARLSVSATFVHADVGYSFPGQWAPHLSVEFDRAGGDRPGGTYTRFDPLFGMRRADFAPAGLYNAVARTNLTSVGARLEVAPSKRLDAFVTYHALWLAAREDAFSSTGVRDASGRSGNFAGHQIDARVRTWIVPDRLRFEFDGVLLWRGRFLDSAPNAAPRGTIRYGSFNLTVSF
jgi:hypothetical protein